MTVAEHQRFARVWDPVAYRDHAAFVPEFGKSVVEWLDPKPGERILDLGCGDGRLTRSLVEAGCVVEGLDASPDFVEEARRRGISAKCQRAESLRQVAVYTAVFSNAALHWMHDLPGVLHRVYRSLCQPGRFVAELGGHGNIAAILAALRAVALEKGVDPDLAHPGCFPTAARMREMLETAGFVVNRLETIPRLTPLPSGIRKWLEVFRPEFLSAFMPQDRPGVVEQIESILAGALRDDRGRWYADYHRLRFDARKS